MVKSVDTNTNRPDHTIMLGVFLVVGLGYRVATFTTHDMNRLRNVSEGEETSANNKALNARLASFKPPVLPHGKSSLTRRALLL